MSSVRPTVCRICVAQCGLLVTVDNGRVVDVRGDPDHPTSQGYTCSKGRALGDFHHHRDRLDDPLLDGETATWDACLDDLATRMEHLRGSVGDGAMGIYSSMGAAFDSAGLMLERRLFRGVLDLEQRYSALMLDCGPLLRVAQLVAGSGWEMNPTWIPEEVSPRLVLFVGCNPVVSHGYQTNLPNAVARIRNYQSRGGAVWVVDPRRTETAELADGHLAVRPGTDGVLLAWLARELLEQGADALELARYCHAPDVDRLRAALQPFDLRLAAECCDIETEQLLDLLSAVRVAGKVAVLSGTGAQFTQHAVLVEWLRWVVAIVTGSVDHEGGMWIPPGWLAPYDQRTQWRHTPADGSDEPGPASRPELRKLLTELPAVALVDEIEAGNLRGLFVAGGSPLTAAPDPERMRAALRSLEFLVVVDVMASELTDLATHVLPVTAMFERSDVVANKSHTCYAPALLPPGATRRSSWWVWAQVARRFGVDLLDGIDPEGCSDDLLNRKSLARSRDGADALIAAGPHGLPQPRLWGWVHERALPDGRWRLAPEVLVDRLPELLAESPADALLFVSQRARRSHNAVRYVKAHDQDKDLPVLAIHPDDATSRGVADGEPATVSTMNAELRVVIRQDERMRPGTVSMTHGWRAPNVAALIDPTADVLTGQPVFSGFAVEVRPG